MFLVMFRLCLEKVQNQGLSNISEMVTSCIALVSAATPHQQFVSCQLLCEVLVETLMNCIILIFIMLFFFHHDNLMIILVRINIMP